MKSLSILLCAFFMLALSANAQVKGRIAGKLVNSNNEPLVGATVKVASSAIGATTDVEGRFVILLAVGKKYALDFSMVGYQSKNIIDVEPVNGKETVVDVVLDYATKREIEGVTVKSVSARKESVNSLLVFQKNSVSVSDGISAEAIKRSPDRNTGEVIKRVSGASIEDNKFVIIRGLIDRYNQATINNSLLPSTEADKRAFSFDLIPSNLIDNIVIYKTASPDLPGDFAGGVIQVTTKDVPNAKSFALTIGAGTNLQSTFKDFKRDRAKSGMDYLGFDNGNRAIASGIPTTRQAFAGSSIENKIEYTKKFNNNLSNGVVGTALPSTNLQLLWNGRRDYSNGGVLGSVIALNYRNSQNLVVSERSDFEGKGVPVYELRDSIYKFYTTAGLLANLSFKKGKNKYTFKNLVNKIFDNSFSSRNGRNFDNSFLVNNNYTETFDKLIANSQFGGEHAFTKSRLDWNLNYTFINTKRPDFRLLEYNKGIADESKPEVPFTYNPRNNLRLWSYLNEHAVGATTNFSKPFEWLDQKQTFKAGFLSQYKMRNFKTRWYRLEEAFLSDFDQTKYTVQPEDLLADANLSRQGYSYNQFDDNTDKYEANTFLNAGYLMVDSKLSDKWRAVLGARVENFTANIKTYERSGELYKVNNNYLDVLPSLNLIYSLTSKSNLRFSASRTVTRPEIRELTYLSYYDYILNATVTGNPSLKRSRNTNLDLRFETYPNSGEVFSATVFYKNFQNPIESYLMPGSNLSNRIVGWVNSPNANSYGVEMEIRKRLDFLGKVAWLEQFTVFVNGTYIKSASDRVTIGANGIATATGETKPMQGQSNYLLNAGLQYTSPGTWSASLLCNKSGYRMSTIGNEFFPDLFENGRTILDFQLAKKIGTKSELRINANDILNQRSIFYYNYGDKYSYSKGNSDVFSSFRYGTNITITYNYTF